jgi:hypothetical protein
MINHHCSPAHHMSSKPKATADLKHVGKSESPSGVHKRLGVKKRAPFVARTTSPRWLLNLFVPLLVEMEVTEAQLRAEEDEEEAAEAERIEQLLAKQGDVGKIISRKLAEMDESERSTADAAAATPSTSAAAAAAAPPAAK